MNNRKNTFIGLVFIILLIFTCINYNFKTRAVDLLDEEIIISNVCIDDDFASDTIIIVLKHNVSLEFIDYTTDNFNEIECIGVKELSEYTTEIIKMQIEADMTGDYSKLKERIEYNTLLDIALYHRILRLTIGNPSKENVINSIRILEKRNDIISAEPDYSGFEETVPDDDYYIDGNQWGLSGFFGINASKAWNYTTGSSDILVGVIDTGIDVSHPDLVNNINNGLHRDYVNHPSGVDYVDVSKANLEDSRGHGTCVSGVIGAQGNNDEGIAGVCWNTKLVSLKVIADSGDMRESDVIMAIDYAGYVNIKIINFSLQIENNHNGVRSQIEIYPGLFVCSAGNKGRDNDVYDHFPSNFTLNNLIAVGAIDSDGYKRSNSNYGHNNVDIFAPGGEILSTYPINMYNPEKENHIAEGYRIASGTSLSAPFVTGVAALMLSVNPNLTPQELKYTIMNNATKYSALTNLCVSGGRLDAYKSVAAALFSITLVNNTIKIRGFNSSYITPNNMELTIPDSFAPVANYYTEQRTVVEIYSEAFKNNTNITSVVLPNSISFISTSSFEGCTGLTSITFPSTSTSIGLSAFKGCTGLINLVIPNSINSISASAFENCTNLTSVSLPNTIITVGQDAFKGCSSLTSITIPSSVSYIGHEAFYNCTSLTNVYIERDNTQITLIGYNVFDGCSNSLSITVPVDRVCEYKNIVNWSNYKTKITYSSSIVNIIELNCLSNFSLFTNLESYKRKLYMVSVECPLEYHILISTTNAYINLYDSNMDFIDSYAYYSNIELDTGIYYYDIGYINPETSGTLETHFSVSNFNGNEVFFGTNNVLIHLHEIDSYYSKNELIYNNIYGPGFYEFRLSGTKLIGNISYISGSISLYNNASRTDTIDRLDILNYNYESITNNYEPSMFVYLPRNGYFYIDINMPNDSYVTLELAITKPVIQNINIFDMTNIMSYSDIQILSNINNYSDYIKEIDVKQTSNFNISFSYSGMQSNNIDIFIIDKDDLSVKYNNTLSSNNTNRTGNITLDSGSYYIGYFNLKTGVITDIHFNRFIDITTYEVYNTLYTDPNISLSGSEIKILEMNNNIKSFYDNNVTVGFTRLIYLDTSNYSNSRLSYYWYSSDDSKLIVTPYGTVLGIDETNSNEVVKVIAINKNNPSIIFEKDFIVNNDNGVGNIIVNNNYSVKLNQIENNTFHLKLETINVPYPMYTYYTWITSNISSGLVVTNDDYGNYTVSGVGTFTITGNNYCFNERVTIVINVTISNN